MTDNTFLMPIKGTPAGGGYSTVEDLLNFSEALLGYRLLAPEATELLLAGKVEIREGVRYAYGFLDKLIEGDLRNGLSHGLFWFVRKDKDCSETHLYYSKDMEFKEIVGPIGISQLFEKTRDQSMYTNCLLNVIADWFESTA